MVQIVISQVLLSIFNIVKHRPRYSHDKETNLSIWQNYLHPGLLWDVHIMMISKMGSDAWSLPNKECCILTWIHWPVASLSGSIGIVSPCSPWSWLKPTSRPFGDLRVNPSVGLGCTFAPLALIWNFVCLLTTLTTVFFWFGRTSTWNTATIIDHANHYALTGPLALFFMEQTFYSPTITHFKAKKPFLDPFCSYNLLIYDIGSHVQ